MASAQELPPPGPLPTPQVRPVEWHQPGLSIILPLSRRGSGPGLIVAVPDSDEEALIKKGIPSPGIKWAEEGFAVGQITSSALDDDPEMCLHIIKDELRELPQCEPKDKFGIVIYDGARWSDVCAFVHQEGDIAAAVVYPPRGMAINSTPIPLLQHVNDCSKPPSVDGIESHIYPDAYPEFAIPSSPNFSPGREAVSHTRSLDFLKKHLGGPYFDLEAIWDEHTAYEFQHRSVPHTMATMVQEPYVNHIPTLTGGIGRGPLSKFYAEHFVHSNPSDTEMELVSRTVGVDRIVDEFVFEFTHDRIINWILPGVPPTGKRVRVPFTAVVNIRGDRLYHEHIAWDQASVLKQIGLLPEYVPWPYSTDGSRMEVKLPVAGKEAAEKMLDKNYVESNLMMVDGLRKAP